MQADVGSAELRTWLAQFARALETPTKADWKNLFDADASWRDFVAFSWTIVTVEGLPAIGRMAIEQAPAIKAGSFTLDPKGLPPSDANGGWFRFETTSARGTGYARLKNGKCQMLMTAMTELKGFEEPAGPRRPRGVAHGAVKHRPNWRDERDAEVRSIGHDVRPYCLIVGGGQNGLALAARLKRLNVPALVMDTLERPGDAWRTRYKSLYLHGPCYNDYFPYLQFPDHWPLYASKDKMGEWLEIYTQVMEIDFWGSARCTKARYDAAADEWVVTVERAGKTITLRPKHLVLATGLSGAPHVPDIPGADKFRGASYHSSKHGDRGAEARGKRCVVIGANNSAHDICQDMWENDAASITMVQRSPTIVIRLPTVEVIQVDSPHAKPENTTEAADLIGATAGFRALTQVGIQTTKRYAEIDADFYRRLTEAGFQLTEGEDRSGFFMAYYRYAAGYYIDVGASDLIASREVAVRSGGVAEILPDGVRLEDGSVLPADIIVYATGYRPLEEWVGELISPEVQAKVGRCWGIGSGTERDPGPWEGELRNMWKPTAQKGLWFQAGSLNQSRFHSLHLALQIKARMEGVPTPVYEAKALEFAK